LYRNRGKKFFGSQLGRTNGWGLAGGYIETPGVPGLGDAGHGQ